MLIHKAYKVELDPNNKQKTHLAKHAGTARFAYNWAIKEKQLACKNGEKTPSYIDLNRKLTQLKKEEFSWMYEVSKCATNEALRDCDKAFARFFNKKSKYPKFKSKKNGLGSSRLTGFIHVFEKQIQLPRLGKIKLKEANYIPKDKKIINATVSEKAGKWFVSVLIQEEVELPTKKENVVGIDLGIKTLATCSDGTIFENPKYLKKSLKKIKKLQRKTTKKKGIKNRQKAKRRLAKEYKKIANQRNDNLHKITTQITKTKSKAVIEDLNVKGMMKNHKLAQAIADVGFYEFRRQLEYKGKWYNCEIVLANRFYPSSKMCSNCGNIKEHLGLDERLYICEVCGISICRDLNGSICLEHYDPDWKNTISSTGIEAFGEDSPGFISNNEVKLFSVN